MGDSVRDTNLEGIRLPPGWMDAHLSSRAMTARDLAKAIGVSEQTLSAAKNGKRISPRTYTLMHQFFEHAPVVFPEALAG